MKLIGKVFISVIVIFSLAVNDLLAQKLVWTELNKSGSFALSTNGKTASLLLSQKDFPGVLRVSNHLQTDIKSVTGVKPKVLFDEVNASEIVIVGTIGRNSLIDKLIESKKISAEEIKGKNETFLIEIVDNPTPNIKQALVIAGSDKRGTIYGMYHLSEMIGVSPWYWWADVPVKKHSEIFIERGKYSLGEPKVKYRGIFINDEAPALSGWSDEKFGGFNSKFYEHVFELILRLKGNFLWPAMWNDSFATDDLLTPKLADEYGVVVSTSHHEPMMRAWKEWERAGNKKGSWDYSKNAENLKEFWREGIHRTKDFEKVVTLAMRGDGDEAMNEEANISLLQNIVKDQRKIIEEVTEKDAAEVPQVWALYKEVQEYYDKGMRVPDDVTILFCDDNWGNLRKLPKLNYEQRKGGFGVYYHYDYVGGPRNYKWLNTSQIERVWEQMHLAYEYGAKQIWVVNVGDIKPMEFPISFFLDFAWNPEKINAEDLPKYYKNWAVQQFGSKYSDEIAELIALYTKYNARIKPELLSSETYSITNYREAENVVRDFNYLSEKANKIFNELPQDYKDAFYQLVLFPIAACANLNEMYYYTALNHLYAKQGRVLTDSLAEKVKSLFKKDAELTHYHNKILSGGKWNHMMNQTHIGYLYWQQPDSNYIPITYKIESPNNREIGVAVEGSDKWWPYEQSSAKLPEYDRFNKQSYYIEVFNRGKKLFDYRITARDSWVQISEPKGKIEKQEKILISIDWNKAPIGKSKTSITVIGPNDKYIPVQIAINNPDEIILKDFEGFIEADNYASINSENYSKAVNTSEINWKVIPNLGRTGSAVSAFPVTKNIASLSESSPRLEYNVFLFGSGEIKIMAYFSPTLNFLNNPNGIRYAVSINDEKPQIFNLTNHPNPADLNYDPVWNKWVADNINIQVSKHNIEKPGKQVVKFWFLDPGVVLQKLVVETNEIKPSYLGPPESFLLKNN
ncbi:MAG: hypothetical protein FD143_1150 [Ignavibacteria bacterium]|nr:MAG: hypothetical protein FD143_1150 [Ignavibacteria bacterium]KAF0160862.1 MAG: hypothetical protein FD188_1361 [Ignavibacteria bacterium]